MTASCCCSCCCCCVGHVVRVFVQNLMLVQCPFHAQVIVVVFICGVNGGFHYGCVGGNYDSGNLRMVIAGCELVVLAPSFLAFGALWK